MLQRASVEDYTLYVSTEPTTLDRVLGWLMNPVAQGIFIHADRRGHLFRAADARHRFSFGGRRAQGGALFRAALSRRSSAELQELLLFVVGLLLLAVEIFVLPGFGIAGVAGIAAVVTGLALRRSTTRACSVTLPRARCPVHAGRPAVRRSDRPAR